MRTVIQATSLCFILLTSSALGQTTNVAGQAIDLNSKGIDRVRVEAIDEAGNLVGTSFTDPNGRFLIQNLPAGGAFSVRFSKVGRVGTTLTRIGGGSNVSAVLPEEWQMTAVRTWGSQMRVQQVPCYQCACHRCKRRR